MRTRSFATLISFLLALFALFASSSPSYAAVGWWNAGGTSGMTSVDVGNNGKNRSFAVSSTGAIYSVIADAAYGSGATLKILSGSVWTTVGTPGFSPGAIYAPIIKIAPDGTPYVSYIDAANGDKPVVRRLVGSSWEDVGSASLAGMVGRRDDTGRDFALAPDGTPYLSINDTQGNSGNVGKLAVLRYQSGVWTPIGGVYNAAGGAGTTYINDGASFWNILAFTSDGTPYVAFEDYGDNAVHGGHIRVRKYVSGAWTTVGPSNISAGSYNDHMAFTIAADDTPYIVYGEMGQSSNPPVVKRWNGSSWVQVGGYVVPGGVLNLGILVDTDGKIYVRLCDGGNGYKQYVYVYDGSNWVNTVPGGQFPGNVAGRAIMLKDPTTGIIYADATANISGFSYWSLFAYYDKDIDEGSYLGSAGFNPSGTGSAQRYGLGFDSSGNAYAAYVDYSAGRNTTIAKWNGSTWSTLGSAGVLPTATGSSNYPVVLVVSPTTEQPYAAYTNTVDSSLRVTRWNGSAWTNVGSTLVTGALVAQYHMAIASNGTPYVVYREPTSPFKIYVQKFDGTSWSVLGGTAASAGDGRQPAIAIAPDGSPYIVYPDVTNNFAATVRRFDGTNWVTVGAPGIGTRSGNTSFGQPSIAISSSGTLYATYSDYSVATGFPYTRVARFDGTNWVNVGGAIGRITTHAFLAFSRTGDLHIAYRETSDYGGLTPAYPFLQNVMKWNGSTWVFVGSPDFAGASALTSMAFDPVRNVPYVLITDENQKISVKAPVQVLSNASPIQISLSAGNVSIASPASVAFPGVTVSNTLQTLDVSAGTFSIEDLKWSGSGYYATISATDLTSGSKTIPKANISATVSGGTVTRIAGSTNASVTVPTSAGTIGAGYVSLANATTLMARSSGGGVLGKYGAAVSLRIGVPAYTSAGNYSGTITVTLIEN